VFNSYTEVSPSGTGLRIFAQGKLSGEGRKRGPIELYDQKRFLTVTGDHLPETPTTIEERQDVVEWLYVAMPIIANAIQCHGERFSLLFAGEWAKATKVDGASFSSASEADLSLCNMLVAGGAQTIAECMAVIRLSGLYDEKWERKDYQERTIGKALEGKGSTAQGAQPTGRRVQVLSARELMRKELLPARWVIGELVPEGLTLFAGDAKVGKSWAVLGMGLAVATGEHVFEYFDTEPGDVLYFALEDSPQRLRERLDTLAKGWELPDNFCLITECAPMPEFEKTLNDMVQQYPETRLIIIDVLAKVEQPSRGKGLATWKTMLQCRRSSVWLWITV
jgi:hypothetical protein